MCQSSEVGSRAKGEVQTSGPRSVALSNSLRLKWLMIFIPTKVRY